MPMEIRTLPEPPRLSGRLVTGYAARFGIASEVLAERNRVFREVLEPGAFRSSLASQTADILALWNHGKDGRPPLGRMPGTLRLWEDAQGLGYELQLPDTAADVREAIDRRDVRGMSFGFGKATDRWAYRDGMAWRSITDLQLFEISFTPVPAYPGTSIESRSQVEIPDAVTVQRDRAARLLRILDRL